ncbi:tRNA 2-thiouridine(34) synthase MnmA [Candidatus Poriferisocius sp.]|uniref:tRNA 2-thiouridine(34) synthase MnmA n=1 Tax=Candidatus Poriferisocius sp. TaxID=3101276 RepID=UPI003B012235
MRVLAAMSGGVDSSVAAAMLSEQGHDVVGVTLKLWGGESDTGCCSVSDVEDARRVADFLGLQHHVFNFGDAFDQRVVAPYVDDHAVGLTPNPCIECNRHIKFDKLMVRAEALGFDVVATGHHARLETASDGFRVRRGVDEAKDQSYVLYMLGQPQMARLMLPIGHLTKAEVRERAAALGLRNSAKPDSQDVCFIANRAGGRQGFLSRRLGESPATVVDTDGTELSTVEAVQAVTIGQRRGLNLGGTDEPRYVTDVDIAAGRVTVGRRDDLYTPNQEVHGIQWADSPVEGPMDIQVSAHGTPAVGVVDQAGMVNWEEPQRRVAPGQAVVFYQGDLVVGGAVAA